jgi:hypothetical protein
MLKISQCPGYTDTAIHAENISMARLYRHRYSVINISMSRLYRHRYLGIKYLNGPAILALLFKHTIFLWSGYTGTVIQA